MANEGKRSAPKKICPKCEQSVAASYRTCPTEGCGHIFPYKKETKRRKSKGKVYKKEYKHKPNYGKDYKEDLKKEKSIHKHRQDFIDRMIPIQEIREKIDWKKEMKHAKVIYNYFLDFLTKIAPPFGNKTDSLEFFESVKGKEYLRNKFMEYSRDVPKNIKSLDTGKKAGKDIPRRNPITLSQFLKDE